MATNNFVRELQQGFAGLFQWGSRYYAEKIGILVGFVVLSLASVVWAFSAPDDTNQLGAELYLRDVLVSFDLAVENTGNRAWTDVRIVLDKKYLFTADRIDGGATVTVNSENLTYAYYIPRPWGLSDWEDLSAGEPPRSRPATSYVPTDVQVRTRQGRLDVTLERP
jgi:hypothetical protein